MTKARAQSGESSALDLLKKATQARTTQLRAKYATRGLSREGNDRTTQSMLLRQLYLAHMETSRFEEALSVSEQMIALGVMPDVARQDAARACLGLARSEHALEHLRIASRVGPASRRAFHLWTLGTTLYHLGRPREAAGILSRAARWGTTAKPLYLAQVALARHAAGDAVNGWATLRERLEEAPCGQGYGQLVLGELAFHQRDFSAAERYLEGFIKKTTAGRVALMVALQAEVQLARGLLRQARAR
ncbi:MAG TPA: tetratricopeptide repeat protein [Polyangiaceae bacterium]|nr:tetratricopeptide repeat protein [Polyangiaceae bacterium]